MKVGSMGNRREVSDVVERSPKSLTPSGAAMIQSQTKLRFSPYLFEVSDELTTWTVRAGECYVYGRPGDTHVMRFTLEQHGDGAFEAWVPFSLKDDRVHPFVFGQPAQPSRDQFALTF